MPKRLFDDTTEKRIIADYLAGQNAPELRKVYKCGTETVYNILKRHGYRARPAGFQKQGTPEDLFHRRYKKLPNGCWQWTGFIQVDGYGRLFIYLGPKRIPRNRIRKTVHRFSYELKYGPIPQGKVIHHICHNRACVNPDHLQVVGKSEHGRMHAIVQSA